MSQKILKFAQKVNELYAEIPADELIAMWEEIATIPPATCKHVFLKGKNANTQCKVKVKEGSEYCNKHSKH